MVWIYQFNCHFFRILNLDIFQARILSKCIDSEYLCMRNSSNSLTVMLIFLKLYMYFFHDLKMCMWFECNPQIIFFYHFFCILNLGRAKRIWYLSPMRAAKVQASLRIRAVSPEPSLLAHTSSESRGTFRQKARSLAPLNGWACAVEICHDGMLEDTNSLDAAHLVIFQARILSKCIDTGCLVCTTPTVLCQSFWNFTGVLVMVWRCASGLDIVLRSSFFFSFFGVAGDSRLSIANIR